jgi:hypothetical protein
VPKARDEIGPYKQQRNEAAAIGEQNQYTRVGLSRRKGNITVSRAIRGAKAGGGEKSHWAEENRGISNVPGGFHLMKQGSVALSLGHKRLGGTVGKPGRKGSGKREEELGGEKERRNRGGDKQGKGREG